jgi:hypothetical protein
LKDGRRAGLKGREVKPRGIDVDKKWFASIFAMVPVLGEGW